MTDYNWQKLNGDLKGLIEFSRENYPNFKEMPEKLISKIFETYKETTHLFYIDGKIKGFALYQEWPNCLNFLMMCLPFGTERENLRVLLGGRHLLPRKKIVWFDETEMKARGIR